jgi:autotransporter family porin
MDRIMHRAFKIIWNVSRQVWMVTGELTRGKSKSSTATSAKKLTHTLSAALFATGLSVIALPAWSVDTYWSTTTGDWLTAGNWNTNASPTSSDNTRIDNSGTAQVSSGTAQASYLFVGYGGTGTLGINGGAVSNTDGYIGLDSGSTGSVTVDGTGSSWINSAQLSVGNSGNGTLGITNGGAVSNTSGYIGNNSGSTGSVTVDGTGSRWTNSGALYVGRQGSGTLRITNGGAVSNTSGSIGNNSGSTGSATVDGTGSRWTNSAQLSVGNSGNGTLGITNGGTVNVNSGTGAVFIGYNAGSIGTLNIGAASGDTAVAAGTLNAAYVLFGAGTGALVFNHTGTDYLFSPSISGAGSIGLFSGSTRFKGDLTNHTGTLTVDGGNLAINSNETLSLGGNYALAAATTHNVNVTDDATYSKLVVAGTATLASNAKININVANPNFAFTTALTNGMLDIISADTLISDGTFAVTDNSLLFNFGAVKDSNTVDLTLTSTATDAVVASTTSPAALGAAAAIDSIIIDDPTGEIASSFVSLTTAQEVNDAVESLLPSISGGMAQMTGNVTSAFTTVVDSRQDTQQGISSGDDFMTDRHIWFKPFGGWAEQDTRQGVSGYDVDSYGLAFGFDGDVSSSWNAGFALAYINSDVASTLAAGAQGVDIDSYLAKVYATNMLDATTALNLQAGVGLSNYDSNRRIFTGDVASADYDSWNVQLSAELTRSYQVSDKTVISPYVHTDYSYVNVDGYSESGAGAFNLNVNDDSNDSLVIGAGLKGNHAVSDSLLLMANAGIGYDAMTDRSSLTSSFAGGGAQFTTDGIEPDEWVYNAGLGAKYSLENGTEITASYDVNARQDFTDQSVSANFRMLF